MTEAVIHSVRSEPDLGTEHIRRVVEMANNDLFQHMFKAASGNHRVINFSGGPADPAEVLRELNMAAKPKTAATAPLRSDLETYIAGQDSLGDPFETVKTASEECASTTECYHDWQRARGLHEHFSSMYDTAALRYDDAGAALVKVAQQAIRRGASTADIVRAMSSAASHPELVKIASRYLTAYLDVVPGVTKTAAVVNETHPLVAAYRDFESATIQRIKLACCIEEADKLERKAASEMRQRNGR